MKRWVLVSLLMLVVFTGGCVTLDIGLPSGPLHQRVVFGKKGPKILMLDISGTLSTASTKTVLGLGGESQTARLRSELEMAAKDDEIRSVLLRIDSPGGTVSASEILYDELLRYKREHGLPMVAQMMGVAASGGYYVSMAADQIRAYPSTITGSIGVVMFGLNLSGLMDKLGIQDQTLTTGRFKDAGSPLRPMGAAERAQLESVTHDLFLHFLDVVEAGRPKLSRERVEALADGRVYSADQALKAGLVDALGDLPGAVDAAREAAGIEGDVRVVVYRRRGEPSDNLFSARSAVAPPQARSLMEWERAGFLYLWLPPGRS